MGLVADEEASLDLDVERFDHGDFFHQGHRVDDDAVSYDACDMLVKDSGWNKVEDVLFLADDDRVAGIGAPLVAGDDVNLVAQEVDYFSFSLVAPLCPHNNCYRHSDSLCV